MKEAETTVTEASEVTASNSDRSQGKKVFRRKSSRPGAEKHLRRY